MPGSVASGTLCSIYEQFWLHQLRRVARPLIISLSGPDKIQIYTT
jgi:hypothetical protein